MMTDDRPSLDGFSIFLAFALNWSLLIITTSSKVVATTRERLGCTSLWCNDFIDWKWRQALIYQFQFLNRTDNNNPIFLTNHSTKIYSVPLSFCFVDALILSIHAPNFQTRFLVCLWFFELFGLNKNYFKFKSWHVLINFGMVWVWLKSKITENQCSEFLFHRHVIFKHLRPKF